MRLTDFLSYRNNYEWRRSGMYMGGREDKKATITILKTIYNVSIIYKYGMTLKCDIFLIMVVRL